VRVLAALPGYLARHGWAHQGTWRHAHVWRLNSDLAVLVPPLGLADSGQPADVLRDLTAGAAR
jgi:hypothetical protein